MALSGKLQPADTCLRERTCKRCSTSKALSPRCCRRCTSRAVASRMESACCTCTQSYCVRGSEYELVRPCRTPERSPGVAKQQECRAAAGAAPHVLGPAGWSPPAAPARAGEQTLRTDVHAQVAYQDAALQAKGRCWTQAADSELTQHQVVRSQSQVSALHAGLQAAPECAGPGRRRADAPWSCAGQLSRRLP